MPAPRDAAPIEHPVIIPGDPASGVVLLCDHASNSIPADYASLGMPASELERHIAYDIGIAGVTLRMAERLGCPAVLSTFSRLLIDPNRGEDDPTLVMRLSDGAVVPGNARADRAEVERRLARFYRPYDRAVGAAVDEALASGVPPAIVSMHSFTPAWKGVPRPWHVTVLWDADPRLPLPLIAALAADRALVVGDNEPYDGALAGDTINRHATVRGLSNVLVEIRQDLIATATEQAEWGDRMAAALKSILADPAQHRVERHPTRTASRHRAAFSPDPGPSI
ncbi:N-formylglutamate amidohydrolase [Alsobacter metallidurans]|uniref:N-formylglutamate amidohydrolase n=1 Tax=Alsobacter metallidurans TaxID=340221 RepID=A0A917IA95_9HYPH|nr:N-formylglutamate amidohydrolase [Alsobacter metallidurans]GGH30156.1 N-formylglutamate amidohydrolase [Alsobacter metallidurans]